MLAFASMQRHREDLQMKTIALGLSVLCASVTLLASEPAHAGQVSAYCTVTEVATFNNRVHIHCTKPITACDLKAGAGGCGPEVSPPAYVAVESNSAMASTTIQIGLSALTTKRLVVVFFDDNAGANPVGCNQNDCRRLIGVVIM
jgi:hypothetical protein